MSKIWIIIISTLVGAGILVTAGILVFNAVSNPTSTPTPTATQVIQPTPTNTFAVTDIEPCKKAQAGVPCPNEENIIRIFFSLINAGQAADAVSMLSEKAAPDDTSRQTWTASLNTWQSAENINIENYNVSSWTATKKIYKVTFDLTLKPNAQQLGWTNGVETRWMELEKEGNFWKINGLTTGP